MWCLIKGFSELIQYAGRIKILAMELQAKSMKVRSWFSSRLQEIR